MFEYKQRLILVMTLILLISISSGCGTLLCHSDRGERALAVPYEGTSFELKIVREGIAENFLFGGGHAGSPGDGFDLSGLAPFIMVLSLVDLPLTFAADTILLPFSLPYHLSSSSEEPVLYSTGPFGNEPGEESFQGRDETVSQEEE